MYVCVCVCVCVCVFQKKDFRSGVKNRENESQKCIFQKLFGLNFVLPTILGITNFSYLKTLVYNRLGCVSCVSMGNIQGGHIVLHYIITSARIVFIYLLVFAVSR